MSENIIHVTDASFEEVVLKSDTPVLVDFWAEWCGPCRMISPILEALAEGSEFTDKLIIVKVNIDENPLTPQKFGVRGIPTLLLFKDGEQKASKVGALSRTQLTDFINDKL